MTPEQIADAAERLFSAEQSGEQIGLLSLQFPQMDMDDAYAVQSALVERKIQSGRRRIGWKIGLTSRAMQMALNIDIPDSGVLLDDMWFDNGATVPAGRFIQPRIEAEIAFVFKDDLDAQNVTLLDVLNATDYILSLIHISEPTRPY